MTQFNQPQYRILGPDEVIQEGDEYRRKYRTEWESGNNCVGATPSNFSACYFRRPIIAPDDLTRELAEALQKALPVLAAAYCIGGGAESKGASLISTALYQANAVLAKYKEQLKTYETIDGKVVKCA